MAFQYLLPVFLHPSSLLLPPSASYVPTLPHSHASTRPTAVAVSFCFLSRCTTVWGEPLPGTFLSLFSTGKENDCLVGNWMVLSSTMLSAAVKELRFLLPATSSPLKAFVQKTYPQIKAQHPHLPVLIRECQGVKPTVVFRLDKGVEVVKHVESFSEPELLKLLQNP